MVNPFELEHNLAITAAPSIQKIITPLNHLFDLKHFRYLKLYGDGSRILLSNHPDCTRYMYTEDRYRNMWFDGEFPEYLKEGQYAWKLNRLADQSKEEEIIENEINQQLGLYHGMTFVLEGHNFRELFSFDTKDPQIYQIDKHIFLRFMLYFKQEAKKLIAQGEADKILVPCKQNLFQAPETRFLTNLEDFLQTTKIHRYYLGGKYEGIYLTEKEMRCIYWLIQGKSAEETALIEGSQAKTIQCHLENVRKKLGCYKQTQLVKIILENSILNSLVNINQEP